MENRGPYLEGRKTHGRRHQGPWLRPATYPCDFKKENGAVCDLESVATWSRCPNGHVIEINRVGAWCRLPPGHRCGGAAEYHNRCALHPCADETVERFNRMLARGPRL